MNKYHFKKADWIKKLNRIGSTHTPCFFIIDFEGENAEIYPDGSWKTEQIQFDFHSKISSQPLKKIPIQVQAISFDSFEKSYDIVSRHLHRGDSYLTNLTFSTPIQFDAKLEDIYLNSYAKYRVLIPERWVCFSPETFIRITQNQVFTYPMKGTIDAKIPNAETILLNNSKEKAEHYTIVDLLRNDLSQIAKKVRVNKFRYIDKIVHGPSSTLQTSSEIVGDLTEHWNKKMGDLLARLLPAGSVSGAPKNKTLAIIKSAETHQRSYYCGIAGYYDGKNLDTCVLIRFIEKTRQGFVYKSGGGITARSNAKEEYRELLQKIYIPDC